MVSLAIALTLRLVGLAPGPALGVRFLGQAVADAPRRFLVLHVPPQRHDHPGGHTDQDTDYDDGSDLHAGHVGRERQPDRVDFLRLLGHTLWVHTSLLPWQCVP